MTLLVLGLLVGSFVAFAATFHLACGGDAPTDAPYAPQEVAVFEALVPDYRRTEESTYLTLLEWYQVFSYQEYAQHLDDARPSAFPYFTSIAQSWTMYCRAYGLTEDAYPFNAGNHLMLFVIGTSFAAEYALKGAYENGWGRIYEWVGGHETPEDRYGAEVARDYGAFIETDPWYAYPFGSKAIGVWTETPFFGEDWPRKMERKVFLSAEYGVKAGYAGLIRVATGAIYGAPPAVDHLWAENVTAEALAVEGVRVDLALGGGRYVLALPHYQGFTDAVPELAARGVRFLDISGNDEIVLTLLAPATWTYDLQAGEELFRLPIPTDERLARVVVLAPVPRLHEVLVEAGRSGATIEHLFDY